MFSYCSCGCSMHIYRVSFKSIVFNEIFLFSLCKTDHEHQLAQQSKLYLLTRPKLMIFLFSTWSYITFDFQYYWPNINDLFEIIRMNWIESEVMMMRNLSFELILLFLFYRDWRRGKFIQPIFYYVLFCFQHNNKMTII